MALILALIGVLFLYQLFAADYVEFREQSRDLLEASTDLAERAREFDQERVLASLPARPFNGVLIRFDDQLPDPSSEPEGESQNVPSGSEEGASDGTFLRGRFGRDFHELEFRRIEERLLPVDENGEPLSTPWEIPLSTLGEVEFRVRTRQAGRLRFLFSATSSESAVADAREVGYVISPIADGGDHLYRIPPKVIWNWKDELDALRSIRVVDETSRPALDIQAVRFTSSTAAFAGRPFGRGDLKLGEEARSGFFLWTSGQIQHELTVPTEKSWLSFGYGSPAGELPREFRVSVLAGGEREQVFLSALPAEDLGVWREARVPLDKWAGREIEVIFEARGENGLLTFWSAPHLATPRSRPFNVVMILEDTFRADALSSNGNPRKATPEKDRWAEGAVVFERAVSGGTHTRISCPTLMTSLQPTATGVWNREDSLSPNYLTLPEMLRDQGFITAAFVQNPEAGRLAGLTEGYSAYFDEEASGDRAARAYDRALGWIEDHRERNFFAYIHITDPHFPYQPEEEFNHWGELPVSEAFEKFSERRQNLKKNPNLGHHVQMGVDWAETMPAELSRAFYDGEVAMNDHHFGRFLDRLKSLGLYESTLLIFVSDHGEYFGEHGYFGHRPPTCEKVIHIPMLMSYPDAFPGGHRVGTRVHLIDVMPTVLDLAGIQADSLLMQGRTLSPELEGKGETNAPRLVVVDDTLEMDARRRVRWEDAHNPPVHWGSILMDDVHAVAGMVFHPRSPTAFQGRLPDSVWMRVSSKQAHQTGARNYDSTLGWNLFLKDRWYRFLSDYQTSNIRIWQALRSEEAGGVAYDEATIEHLKKLGYL